MTTFLPSAFAVLDLAAGLILVRDCADVERRQPAAVLVVSVLLVLAPGLVLVVVVRLHVRPGVVCELAPGGSTAVSNKNERSTEVDAVSAHSSNRLQAEPIGKVISGDTALCVVV